VNTANRVLWAVVGLLLLALGVFGTLASLGRLPRVPPDSVLLPVSRDATWHRFGTWSPVATIAAGLVVMLLGWLLLRAELRRRQGRAMSELVLPSTAVPGAGATVVESGILEKALSRDLSGQRPLTGATAYLTGEPTRPTLTLRLAAAPDADLGQVKDIVDGALRRFAATSGVSPRIGDVDVRIADPSARPGRTNGHRHATDRVRVH
jgi:hypothetical protein